MGTMTITTTGAQDSRIVAAFGRRLGLPGNASAAQVKANIIKFIKDVVEVYERDVANEAIVLDPLEPT